MFDEGLESLPEGIESMSSGTELAAALAKVDVFRLSEFDRVVFLKAQARQLAHRYAEFCQTMVAVAQAVSQAVREDGVPGDPHGYASDEIRSALSLTRRAAEHELSLAWSLVVQRPAVWKALWEGRIDQRRAAVICEETEHLSDADATRFSEGVLEEAEQLTTGQLRARLRRRIIEYDPGLAKTRYEKALEERALLARHNEDGSADLAGCRMDGIRTLGVFNRIDRLARKVKTADDPRTIDQVRADIFLDLLEGRSYPEEPESSPRGVVDIRVDLSTLIGLDENPGEIPGWGPVIADIARQVAARQQDGEWRITVTDPDSGAVSWDGTTRRRPTVAQKRYVQARHPTCVFPGCRVPAGKSDLNHLTPYSQGGATLAAELIPLCRHDHRLVHQGGWRVGRLDPRTYEWTSPLDHRYIVEVHPP